MTMIVMTIMELVVMATISLQDDGTATITN